MKGLFLVFHGFAAHNGISKKIFSQLAALQACGLDAELCYVTCSADGHWKRMAGGQVVEDFGPGLRGKIGKRIRYGALTRYILEKGIEFVYMRGDHNANPFLNRWLGQMKRMGVKVVMEIPTYPYDSEYNCAPLRARAVLQADKIFRGAMARRLSRIVTFSDLPSIFGVPTIRISNGIDFEAIPVKASENRPGEVIRLTGVADIHFWHGFDRVIEGMANYYKAPGRERVEFHIIGSGTAAQLEKLRDLAVQHRLEDRVIFHGPQSGAGLDAVFEATDMGIASLGRHRCGIDRIKTLKNREYAARGIPFVYSETDGDFDAMPYVMKASADESPLDIAAVARFCRNNTLTPAQIRSSVAGLSWAAQMQKVLDEVLNK